MEKVDNLDDKFIDNFPGSVNDEQIKILKEIENLNFQIDKLNKVKNDLWMGGIKGGGAGLSIGYLSFLMFKTFNKSKNLKKYNHPNYFVSSVLTMGCLGMYLGSVVNGKNSLQFASDVFIENSKPTSHYLSTLNNNNKSILNNQNESFIRRNKQINDNKIKKQINER